jgi:hypothetical protein
LRVLNIFILLSYLERVKDRFNFKSKIKCQVEFMNFIDLYNRVILRKCEDKKQSFKNNIKEFEKIVLRHEILSLNGVGKFGTVFWKCPKNEIFVIALKLILFEIKN